MFYSKWKFVVDDKKLMKARVAGLKTVLKTLPQAQAVTVICAFIVFAVFPDKLELRVNLIWLVLISAIAITWSFMAVADYRKDEFRTEKPWLRHMVMAAVSSAATGLYIIKIFPFTDGLDSVFLGVLIFTITSTGAFILSASPPVSAVWITVLSGIILYAVINEESSKPVRMLSLFILFIIYTIYIVNNSSKILRSWFLSRVEAEEKNDVIKLLLSDFEKNTSDWLWEIDEKGDMTYLSYYRAEQDKEHKNELYGQNYKKLITDSMSTLTAEDIEGINRLEERLKLPLPFQDFAVRVWIDNNYRWLSFTGKPLLSENGEINGWRGVGRDITGRRKQDEEKHKLAERTLQIQKMESLGTLAAGIAHDFNNILSGILGYSELAKMGIEGGKNGEAHSHLGEIIRASLRARELIRQIMAFSRKSGIEKRPVEIIPVIKETLKLLRATIPANIDIKLNIPETRFIVEADSTQIHQVMMNLCTNASLAIQNSVGYIDITLKEMETDNLAAAEPGIIQGIRYLQIVVSDNGCGIPPEIIPRIFDPFFTTRERDQGTGMGLSVVHGIVKNMGGSISVSSEPGKGASFRILLPMIDSKIAVYTEMYYNTGTVNARLLFVDDEESIITTGSGILRRLGYNVITADNGADAIDKFNLEPQTFDCVMTDMNMTGMTGLELATRLKKIRPDIPVILTTGFNPGLTPEAIAEAGIMEIVIKPLIADEIVRVINRALVYAKTGNRAGIL